MAKIALYTDILSHFKGLSGLAKMLT